MDTSGWGHIKSAVQLSQHHLLKRLFYPFYASAPIAQDVLVVFIFIRDERGVLRAKPPASGARDRDLKPAGPETTSHRHQTARLSGPSLWLPAKRVKPYHTRPTLTTDVAAHQDPTAWTESRLARETDGADVPKDQRRRILPPENTDSQEQLPGSTSGSNLG
ncbi:uncharacterized protein AAES06_013506 isoform 2-T2 [Glossophaga mutica]